MRISTLIQHVCVGTPQWLLLVLTVAYTKLFRPAAYESSRDARVKEHPPEHPPVDGVSHEDVKSNGQVIHVARAGIDPKKQLLLFLHGFPEFWYSWRAQILALKNEFEIAAIDLPGYNASSKSSQQETYLTGNVCATVAGVLEALGRQTCVLVGHDWGGAIAWDFAALYPNKITALAVLACPPRHQMKRQMDLKQLLMSSYMWRFQLPTLPELEVRKDDYAILSAIFCNPKFGGCRRKQFSEQEVELYKDALARPGALTSALNYYRALLTDDAIFDKNKEARRAWKKPLEMPVMLLWGDSDVALSLNLLTKIGACATRLSVHVLPNCSHWIQQDALDEVNDLLRAFAHGKLKHGIPRL